MPHFTKITLQLGTFKARTAAHGKLKQLRAEDICGEDSLPFAS